MAVMAYCVKCRAKREVKDVESVILKNKKNAIRGLCAECGTQVFQIVRSEDAGLKAA
jgi:predicted  nucleic acid-binding Zn-ribbon protein